jgi:hypothetical protein
MIRGPDVGRFTGVAVLLVLRASPAAQVSISTRLPTCASSKIASAEKGESNVVIHTVSR